MSCYEFLEGFAIGIASAVFVCYVIVKAVNWIVGE